MFRKTGLTTTLILAVLLVAAAGHAQTALGTLRGVVLDQQGGALPGATVTIRHLGTNTTQATVSTAERAPSTCA